LRLRGLGHVVRAEQDVDTELLNRIDVIWEAASGLSFQKPAVVASLHTHGLLLALKAGEPSRLARAILLEAMLTATAGAPAAQRAGMLLDRARSLVEQLGRDDLRPMVRLAEGVIAFLQVKMPQALELLGEAERSLSAGPANAWWELAMARSLIVWAHMHVGAYRELERCASEYGRDAEQRGDWFLLTSIRGAGIPQLQLAADRPDAADEGIREVIGRFPYEEFQQQHMSLLYSQTQVDHYRGDGWSSWRRFQENWPRLRRSMQLHNQFMRVSIVDLRARSALLASLHSGDRAMLRHAQRDAQRLRRERGDWVRPVVGRLLAGIAEAECRQGAAIVALRETLYGFESIGFRLCAAAAKRRLGQLVAGQEGVRLVREAEEFMASEGIRCPERTQTVFLYGIRERARNGREPTSQVRLPRGEDVKDSGVKRCRGVRR
jgi:hypothetical protein